MKNNTAPGTIAPLKFPEKFGFLTFSTASNVVYQFKSIYYLFFPHQHSENRRAGGRRHSHHRHHMGRRERPADWLLVGEPQVQNGERCRPFALWFALPWAVSVVLLFCDFKTPQTITVILALVIYFLFETANTFVAIPTTAWAALPPTGIPTAAPSTYTAIWADASALALAPWPACRF